MIQSFMNSSQIINYFTGQTDDYSEVLANFVPSTNKKILNNYTPRLIKMRIKEDLTYDNFVNINSLNALKIKEVMHNALLTGWITGVGLSLLFTPASIVKTTLCCGFVSGAIGVIYCIKNDLYNKEAQDNRRIELEFDRRFEEFKDNCTKEQYSLFINFVKNYVQLEDIEMGEDFNMFCGITFEIPSIPVFSPHDEKRRHVYDRKEIEKQIDIVDAQISRAILSGCKPEYIDGLRQNYDPYKGPAFGKNDLVMDINFLKKSICAIQSCLDSLLKDINPEKDPILKKGLTCLLNHYKSHHRQCTAGIINNLFVDLSKMGMNLDDSKEICKEFKNSFDA